MDESALPVIAVLGFPIGGNPVHFALERAFQAMNLDWRVVSFELPPEHVGVALDGIEILGVRGVWLDDQLASSASQWIKLRAEKPFVSSLPSVQQKSSSTSLPWIDRLPNLGNRVDCLHRGEATFRPLQPADQRLAWLSNSINGHFSPRGIHPQDWLVLGEGANRVDFPPDPNRLLSADVIVIPSAGQTFSSGPPADPSLPDRRSHPSDQIKNLDALNWPPNDANKLVIDLTQGGHPEIDIIRNQGYKVLGHYEQLVGSIQYAFSQWTDQTVSKDLLNEAVEEFLSI